MTDNKRIKECKRKVIAAINEATLPFAVTELILENVLNAVRENMAAEPAEPGEKRMKQGTQFVLPVEIGMSLDEISRIEFVFKQKNYNGFPAIKSNVWPDDCTRQEGQNIILIPWTRAETYKFMGGETLYMDTRITLRDSADQPQTEILALKMSPTLFQEVDGA